MRILKGYIDRMERETVVAHTVSGKSIRGVLASVNRDSIVLIHASFLNAQGPSAIDGEAIVPRVNVDWLQRLPAEVTAS
jgi:hypothetical protein